jgi:hypothetical protein
MMKDQPDHDGFDGVWQMRLSDSKVLDPLTKEWVPEVIKNQVAEIRHDGDVIDFRCRIDHADDLSLYLHYNCRYGADEWSPYSIVHIEGDPEHESLRPNHFRRHHARAGGVMGYVKEVYVDPRTRIRITRHPTGEAQYMLMSRLSEDGDSLVGKVMSADGDAAIEKVMVGYDGPALTWPVTAASRS